MLRGQNWCGIEALVCYARPTAKPRSRHHQLALEKKAAYLMRLQYDMPRVGGWQQHNTTSTVVVNAAHHHITRDIGMHEQRRGISLSRDPNHFRIERAYTQVVSGYHVHVTMSTKDAVGNAHLVHALMHRNHSGHHTTMFAHAHPAKESTDIQRSTSVSRALHRLEQEGGDSSRTFWLLVVAVGCLALGILVGITGHVSYQRHSASPATTASACENLNPESERPRATSAATIDVHLVPKGVQGEDTSANANAANPADKASNSSKPAHDAVPTT